MTAAEIDHGSPAVPARARPAVVGARLAWLHLASRRAPAATGLLAAISALLWASLNWHWNIAGGPSAQRVIPLTIEAGTAAVIAVSTYGPFGEPERATGRWLPWLRLAAAFLLTAAAVGALAAAGAGAHLAGGPLDVLRNVAGITGIGLLCAATISGGLAWIGPVAYLIPGLYALYTQWHHPALTTPWLWPGRPPHDLGAAICAGLVFAAGVAAITVRGARDVVGEPA